MASGSSSGEKVTSTSLSHSQSPRRYHAAQLEHGMEARLEVELDPFVQGVDAVEEKPEALVELVAVDALGPGAVHPAGVVEVRVSGEPAALEVTGPQLEGCDLLVERRVVQAVVVVVDGVELRRRRQPAGVGVQVDRGREVVVASQLYGVASEVGPAGPVPFAVDPGTEIVDAPVSGYRSRGARECGQVSEPSLELGETAAPAGETVVVEGDLVSEPLDAGRRVGVPRIDEVVGAEQVAQLAPVLALVVAQVRSQGQLEGAVQTATRPFPGIRTRSGGSRSCG